jgi:uncharacterized protein with GYD domain
MATFIALGNFTDQGIRNVKDTVKRADAVKEAARKAGITMKDIMWTLGSYDMVVTFEAPDDASITAFALAIGAAGNVRTQTLRAFDRSEMTAILGKLT